MTTRSRWAVAASAVSLVRRFRLEALDADVLAVVRSTVQPSHATLWIRR